MDYSMAQSIRIYTVYAFPGIHYYITLEEDKENSLSK